MFRERLRLDYVILEAEYNNGSAIIEKFLRNAEDCRYAVALFSADDVGKLNADSASLKHRTRQNVILELGYFLAKVGRKNILFYMKSAPPLKNLVILMALFTKDWMNTELGKTSL